MPTHYGIIAMDAAEGIMSEQIEAEVDKNFDFFQRVVSGLLDDHSGEFALLRHQQIVEFFSSSVSAITAGYRKYSDGLFSVQEVVNTPVDLGFYSHAANPGKDF